MFATAKSFLGRILPLLTVVLLFLIPQSIFAQTSFNVNLTLQDANTGEPVGFATVTLTKAGAKNPTKYALTADSGKATIEKVGRGEYTLRAELLGYKAYEKTIKVENADLNLGTLKMDTDAEALEAARVTDVGNPIVIKKDTVEYNANSFKTTDNDVLEDLLKKLPGIEISDDGTITHNGETISKITIGGKTFFLDDPQLASKNLPAKMIEKVKVVRKKSEQAEFTGIDDGQETTILDLSVRPGMMNGVFGNLTAGGGHDIPESGYYDDDHPFSDGWRYQGSLFAGRFTEHSQISLILNGNNTNNRSFSDMAGNMMAGARGGGGMGGGQMFGTGNGITTSWMGGLNGAWDLFDNRMNLGGNYVYNGSKRSVEEESLRLTTMDDYTLLYQNDGFSDTNSYGNRFGIRLEHKFSDNTSILFEPQINFGKGDFQEFNRFSTVKDGSIQTNDGFNDNTGDNNSVSTSGRFLLRQRLGIPGRTLTFNAQYSISNNDLDGFTQSLTNTYRNDEVVPEIVNQRYDQNQKSHSVSGTLTYTEPLGNNWYVEGNYTLSYSKSTSEKDTYDSGTVGTFTEQSHLYNPSGETRNITYSNSVLNRYINQNIGANLMYQKQGLRAQAGIGFMPTNTHNETERLGVNTTYTNHVVNIAPRAMLMYDMSQNQNIRIMYNGRSQQPNVNQLMNVPDNSNPLSLSFGNPNLEPYFNHNLRVEYRFTNRQTFTSMNVNFSGGMVQNPIVNASWYDLNGVSYSMPVNGPNSSNYNLRVFLNSPIAKSNFSIFNQLTGGFNQSYSFIGKSRFDSTPYYDPETKEFNYEKFNEDFPDLGKADEFNRNRLRTFNGSERLRLTYRNDFVELTAGGASTFRKSWSTTGSASTKLTRNDQVTASMNWTIAGTWTLQSDFNYNWYKGYSTAMDDEFVLNAYISKMILHNTMTVTLRGYDLFNQEKSISARDSGVTHTESRNNTLGRYVILSLTYRFGSAGSRGNRGGRGGFGGGRGMGGPGGGFGGGRPPM